MSLIQPVSDFSELPVLYAIGSKKTEVLQWKTFTKGPVVYFQHGKVGFKQIESKYTAEAVNLNKANFRDPVAQAKFESNAAWTRKMKEGYYLTTEEAKSSVIIRPMKAHRLDQQGKKLRWPCHAQRKYNGYRCLAICNDDHTFLMSNGGETWNVPHILEELKRIMKPGMMLDGELYVHGVSLQRIGSLVKANRPESAILEFHLYDMPQKDGKLLGWDQRLENLKKQVQLAHDDSLWTGTLTGRGTASKLHMAETVVLHNEEQLAAFNAKVIAEGYEGVILRNFGGEYKFNYRSYDVFKHKDFKDSEFTVIDARSRIHSVNGTDTLIVDVFVCKDNLNGTKTFEVVPRGDLATKAEFWENRSLYIGRRLTVRFLERSDDGIPQGNPVGVAFRAEEDHGEDVDEEFL